MEVHQVTSKEQLDQAIEIRMKVFVNEQQVPEELEKDEHDQHANHVLLYNQSHEPIGTGRCRIMNQYGKIERVCVLKEYRKGGNGKRIITKLEEILKEKGIQKFKLHAQTQAKAFYEKLGYKITSDIFYDANIPHIEMTKEV
ncbi:GNAT family N-acetyltransferase [Bacillus carboniphilus]|uniref:GNAT family N-acetyltransferase n=1 Tax=Bacillus carboniphilus TaxID=86663 RepID=A0ABY9JXC6_9BACI|nr:GNAT family N-acetyltransferase [Bacillus carboniphilus]WLR42978.1 GNAT family N-acetyltransferase [Bacillus carboniphilus]